MAPLGRVPVCFFEGTDVGELPANQLVMRIQPDEGVSLVFVAKEPGGGVSAQRDDGFLQPPPGPSEAADLIAPRQWHPR